MWCASPRGSSPAATSGATVDQTLEGWTSALRIMHLYLTHFAGQSVTTLLVQQEVGTGTNPEGGRWDLVGLAGLRPGAVGRDVATASPVPPLAGVVECVDDEQIFVRTKAPGPGIAGLATMHYGASPRWWSSGTCTATTRVLPCVTSSSRPGQRGPGG